MIPRNNQPCLVHAGPFANIAVGQSSIIGDRVGLKMFDYHITESVFAADIGFEKFWNVKCRLSGLTPHVSVPDDNHSGLRRCMEAVPLSFPDGPSPTKHKGKPPLLEKGLANMTHLIGGDQEIGINPVVCINAFHTDTQG